MRVKWKRMKWAGIGAHKRRVKGSEGRNITLHLSKITRHTRKCIQHQSPTMEEIGIEKGKSGFVHLTKTSQWRQSISNSLLLKRAWWKYSSSQHKRSWHTLQSIGCSQFSGKFYPKQIWIKLNIGRICSALPNKNYEVCLNNSNNIC